MSLIFALALSSCTSYQAANIDDFVFSSRVLRVEKDGIVIGIEPYFDTDQIENTFGLDMSRGGYYPLRLRITNLGEKNIVISRERIAMIDRTGSQHPSISSESVAEDLRHNSVAYGILGFGIFSFMSAEKANAAMRKDWAAKELSRSSFLGKGDSNTGFVFVRLPPEIAPQSTSLQLVAAPMHGKSEISLTGSFSP